MARISIVIHIIALVLNLAAVSYFPPVHPFVWLVFGAAMLISIIVFLFYRASSGANYAAAAFQFGSALYLAGTAPLLIGAIVLLTMLPALVVER